MPPPLICRPIRQDLQRSLSTGQKYKGKNRGINVADLLAKIIDQQKNKHPTEPHKWYVPVPYHASSRERNIKALQIVGIHLQEHLKVEFGQVTYSQVPWSKMQATVKAISEVESMKVYTQGEDNWMIKNFIAEKLSSKAKLFRKSKQGRDVNPIAAVPDPDPQRERVMRKSGQNANDENGGDDEVARARASYNEASRRSVVSYVDQEGFTHRTNPISKPCPPALHLVENDDIFRCLEETPAHVHQNISSTLDSSGEIEERVEHHDNFDNDVPETAERGFLPGSYSKQLNVRENRDNVTERQALLARLAELDNLNQHEHGRTAMKGTDRSVNTSKVPMSRSRLTVIRSSRRGKEPKKRPLSRPTSSTMRNVMPRRSSH